MYIKVYTANNDVRIIEKVSDVRVHLGKYGLPPKEDVMYYDGPKSVGHGEWGPYTDYAVCRPYSFPICQDPQIKEALVNEVRVIDYMTDTADNPGWQRIIVTAYAYICNDDGKTIERVMNETR